MSGVRFARSFSVVASAMAVSCATAGTLATGDDNGTPDAAALGADGGTADGPAFDNDAGFSDDTSVADAGRDAGHVSDAHANDAASSDTGVPPDASSNDAGVDAGTDAGTADAGGCTLVVNELLTGVTGSATNEWVEVYNSCPTPLDLSGWKLVYRAGSNVSSSAASFDTSLFAWPSGATIAAHGFLLYAGAGYGGASDGALASGMKDGDGSVGIRNASAALVDSVGYGTVLLQNAFIETSPAPANAIVAAPGNSIRRLPDGHDTNSNATDFANTTTPTPRAPNQ